MANFKTHLSVASSVSGLVATCMLAAEIIPSQMVILCFILGSIGGILPDIDSGNSIPLTLTFNILSPIIAFVVMFSQNMGDSLAELILIWGITFLTVKYVLFASLLRLTFHRGLIHSIPAGVLFGLLTTLLSDRLFHFSNFSAWITGFFLFFGFLIHLILDEWYSIDFSKRKIKNSFGTALKLIRLQNLKGTLLIYIAIIFLFLLTPDPKSFYKTILNKNTYLQIHLLPQGQWLKGVQK